MERVQLTQDEIQLLSRTVRREPEVMVKVLTQGGRDLKAVGRHLTYLSRDGELEIETDDGFRLVLKAVSEEGVRLNIRKATLREWRRRFARHLREQGIAANATERAVRGVAEPRKLDGIYRAALRSDSTHWRQRAVAVAREMTTRGEITPEASKAQLVATRRDVEQGWRDIGDHLVLHGEVELATAVREFVTQFPAVRTEREWIRDRMFAQARVRSERCPNMRDLA